MFTGGIGENSAAVRSSICGGLTHLGIELDEGKNAAVSGNITEIGQDGVPVRVLVVRTDEEREIARQTVQSIERAGII